MTYATDKRTATSHHHSTSWITQQTRIHKQGGYSLTVGLPSPPKALLPTAVRPLKEAGRLKGSANQRKQLTGVLLTVRRHYCVTQLCYARMKARSVSTNIILSASQQWWWEGGKYEPIFSPVQGVWDHLTRKTSTSKQNKMLHTAGRPAIQQKQRLHLKSANISIFLSFHSLPTQFDCPQETTLSSKAISKSGNCACKTPSGHASAMSPTPQAGYIWDVLLYWYVLLTSAACNALGIYC